MKIKICGMKYAENIQKISALKIDLMGFIFYSSSARDAGSFLDVDAVHALPASIQKVGVFVNEDLAVILKLKDKYALDYIQLHGEESAEYCQSLKEKGVKIIKAFAIHPHFDFSVLLSYQDKVDYFLFDAAGMLKGGNGTAFDWQLLSNYGLSIPFLLSGGIGLNNIDSALAIKHVQLAGLDLNSQLELEAGLKSFEAAALIINKIQDHANH